MRSPPAWGRLPEPLPCLHCDSLPQPLIQRDSQGHLQAAPGAEGQSGSWKSRPTPASGRLGVRLQALTLIHLSCCSPLVLSQNLTLGDSQSPHFWRRIGTASSLPCVTTQTGWPLSMCLPAPGSSWLHGADVCVLGGKGNVCTPEVHSGEREGPVSVYCHV